MHETSVSDPNRSTLVLKKNMKSVYYRKDFFLH